MDETYLEWREPGPADCSITADVLFREKPGQEDEDEEEEDEESDGDEEDGDGDEGYSE